LARLQTPVAASGAHLLGYPDGVRTDDTDSESGGDLAARAREVATALVAPRCILPTHRLPYGVGPCRQLLRNTDERESRSWSTGSGEPISGERGTYAAVLATGRVSMERVHGDGRWGPTSQPSGTRCPTQFVSSNNMNHGTEQAIQDTRSDLQSSQVSTNGRRDEATRRCSAAKAKRRSADRFRRRHSRSLRSSQFSKPAIQPQTEPPLRHACACRVYPPDRPLPCQRESGVRTSPHV